MEQAVVLCRVILVAMDLPLLCATQMEAHSPSQAPARPIRAPWQAHVDIAILDQEPLEQAVVLSRVILVTMDLPPQCATQMKAATMLNGTPDLHGAPMQAPSLSLIPLQPILAHGKLNWI